MTIANPVIVPKSGGVTSTKVNVVRWIKHEGDPVKHGEPLVELETEKATTQVASPANGTLHIDVPEGETVAIGAVVGHLQEEQREPLAGEIWARVEEESSEHLRPS